MDLKELFTDEFLNLHGVALWGHTNSTSPQSYHLYESWLSHEFHGKLNYLNDHRSQKRKSLLNIYPEAKGAFVFCFPYKKSKPFANGLKVASYAMGFNGEDYHFLLRENLEKISVYLQNKLNIETKTILDIEPVLERDLAFQAGLGWFGKNSMLINKHLGSYFLIGSILVNEVLDLKEKINETDHCGTCRKCIDLCPTEAITDERTIIADRCISTYTIETFKDAPAPLGYENLSAEFFGCDICQDVCPWNHRIESEAELVQGVVSEFFSKNKELIFDSLEQMSNREFKRKFYGTALARPGRVGVLKSLKKLKK